MPKPLMPWCAVSVVAVMLAAMPGRAESPLDRLDRSLVPDRLPREVVAILEGPGDSFQSLAFSDDCAALVVGDINGTLRLWRFSDDKVHPPLKWDAGVGIITAVALNADASLLAVAGDKQTLALWDCRGEKPGLHAALRDRPREPLATLQFTPANTLLAVAWRDKAVRCFDFSSGAVWERSRLEHEEDVCRLALSPDGRMLALGGDGADLVVYELASGKERSRFCEHKLGVAAVAFTGGDVTTVDGSGRRRRWSLREGDEIDRPRKHEGDSPSMALSAGGGLLESSCYALANVPLWGTAETSVMAWREDGERYGRWEFPGSLKTLHWAPDNRHALVVHSEGPLFLLRVPQRPLQKGEGERLTPLPRSRVH